MTGRSDANRVAETIRRMEDQFPDADHGYAQQLEPDTAKEARQWWGVGLNNDPLEFSHWVDPAGEVLMQSAEGIDVVGPRHGWFPRNILAVGQPVSPSTSEALRVLMGRVSARWTDDPIEEKWVESPSEAEAPSIHELLTTAGEVQTPSGATIDVRSDARIKLDFEYVWRRLTLLFSPRQCRIWLQSNNSSIGGRPMDAILIGNTSAVIDAVDVEEQAAFG